MSLKRDVRLWMENPCEHDGRKSHIFISWIFMIVTSLASVRAPRRTTTIAAKSEWIKSLKSSRLRVARSGLGVGMSEIDTNWRKLDHFAPAPVHMYYKAAFYVHLNFSKLGMSDGERGESRSSRIHSIWFLFPFNLHTDSDTDLIMSTVRRYNYANRCQRTSIGVLLI